MFAKSKIAICIFLIVAISLGIASESTTRVQASASAQTAHHLAGYRIYFSEENAEASRFDRSEAGLSRFGGLIQGLGAELLTLDWRSPIPQDADLVIIAGPMWNLSPWRIARLWVYLSNGGSLLLLADVNGNTDTPGLPGTSGIFELLWIDVGLLGRDDIVTKYVSQPSDKSAVSGSDTVQSQDSLPLRASATFTTTNVNGAHPITSGLEGELAFSVARSLEISGSYAPFQIAALVYTDDSFYGETSLPENVDDETFVYKYDHSIDTLVGALPVAAAVESMQTQTRIVCIGDRDFGTNGFGLQTLAADGLTFRYPGNAQFLLNSVTWLLKTDAVEQSTVPQSPSASSVEPTPQD